jgi:hypothetical protein
MSFSVPLTSFFNDVKICLTSYKDECTWTRLTSVVFTRKRPFTEEQLVLNDTKLILDHIGRSLGLLAGERAIRGFTRNIIVVFLNVLFRTFDVILQWRQNMSHVIFHVWGVSWSKILYFGYIFKRFFFLLEAFWLDVTTSKDECTWTRLTSVVFTRKRPFTEEQLVLNDTKLILDHIGRSLASSLEAPKSKRPC